MRVGFTGTQNGMTDAQKASVHGILLTLMAYHRGILFDHGDCVGADAEAHDIALGLGWGVILHPPKNESKRAFCQGAMKVYEPEEYLDRNKSIVVLSELMIATPGERENVLRSGTWSTIRYAKSHRRNVLIVYPEGDLYLQEFTESE